MELDLTEAIEAGRAASFAAYEARTGVFPANRSTQTEHYVAVYADAAVRAAAPIIERAVREQVASQIRSYASEVATRAEALAGVETGVADNHRFMIGMEVAAAVAEKAEP